MNSLRMNSMSTFNSVYFSTRKCIQNTVHSIPNHLNLNKNDKDLC